MRKLFMLIFGMFDLWLVFMLVTTGDYGFFVPLFIGLIVLGAIWTNTLHMIPGDAETELYRIRMLMEEQAQDKKNR